jgi:hypothetical protein
MRVFVPENKVVLRVWMSEAGKGCKGGHENCEC